jgi:hypothetical protein
MINTIIQNYQNGLGSGSFPNCNEMCYVSEENRIYLLTIFGVGIKISSWFWSTPFTTFCHAHSCINKQRRHICLRSTHCTTNSHCFPLSQLVTTPTCFCPLGAMIGQGLFTFVIPVLSK